MRGENFLGSTNLEIIGWQLSLTGCCSGGGIFTPEIPSAKERRLGPVHHPTSSIGRHESGPEKVGRRRTGVKAKTTS